jgi:ATP-dependent helicase HrpB
MAELLGEEPGATVGYAMRMENSGQAKTRIDGRHRGRALPA